MEYTIDFYSYWLIGSGIGGSSKDSLILKDTDGLPFIPGRTLKGLLRDAYCECGNTENEILLFGHQKHDAADSGVKKNSKGKLYFSSAYLPKDIRDHLTKNPELKEGLFSTKTSTRLDKDKQAKDHSLRKIEVCIPLTLEAQIVPLRDTIEDTEKEQLKRAMKMLRLIGEKRHRGLGRCKVTLKENRS